MSVTSNKYAFNGIDVQIMGREELEALSRDGFSPGTYVISITDVDAPLVTLRNRPAAVLRMTFDDVGDEDFPISCHVMDDADEKDPEVIDLISNPITKEDAARMARFVDGNLANMKRLICQCEMG